MEGYTAATYGDRIAGIYDELYGGLEIDAPVQVLADLAAGGPALELGIGTGRIALPLVGRGVEVHGIDASPAMVAELRTRPGGYDIPVTFGSFGDSLPAGPYRLIYAVFNTFFALLTQEEQVNCFRLAAQRLLPGGCFLLRCFQPDMGRFYRGQEMVTERVELDRVQLAAGVIDVAEQRVNSQHIQISSDGIRLYPVALRYAWPAELDLMARLAGLRLRSRWGDWTGAPFTGESGYHVSIYEQAPEHDAGEES